MECGVKMAIPMDMKELIFKDDSTLLVHYDANTNVPLLASFSVEYITEVFYSL